MTVEGWPSLFSSQFPSLQTDLARDGQPCWTHLYFWPAWWTLLRDLVVTWDTVYKHSLRRDAGFAAPVNFHEQWSDVTLHHPGYSEGPDQTHHQHLDKRKVMHNKYIYMKPTLGILLMVIFYFSSETGHYHNKSTFCVISCGNLNRPPQEEVKVIDKRHFIWTNKTIRCATAPSTSNTAWREQAAMRYSSFFTSLHTLNKTPSITA